MKSNRLAATVAAIFVLVFAGTVASAQQLDRFKSEAACMVAVKDGTAVWYQPSFFDHRNRQPSRPVATTRALEERACVELWIVGGWAFVPQPGVPQTGDKAPKFDFDADGKPIRRSDCGNRVRKIIYVPVPPPPTPEPEPERQPEPKPAKTEPVEQEKVGRPVINIEIRDSFNTTTTIRQKIVVTPTALPPKGHACGKRGWKCWVPPVAAAVGLGIYLGTRGESKPAIPQANKPGVPVYPGLTVVTPRPGFGLALRF